MRGYRVYYIFDFRRFLSVWYKYNIDVGFFIIVGSLLFGIIYSLRVLVFIVVGDGSFSFII